MDEQPVTDSSPQKPSFESMAPAIEAQIDKRRGGWRLASIAWDDVRQKILTRVFFKYDTFDPVKGKFPHWLSAVITSVMKNELRDHHSKFSRPCITGCPHNSGGDTCNMTPSKMQCGECLLYKNWEKRKMDHYRVEQTLPLENHEHEVQSIIRSPFQSDFIDVVGAKEKIDAAMRDKLTNHEYQVYVWIYVEGKTEQEVGQILGYKKVGKMYPGYQQLLKMRKLIVEKAREIIEEQDLA